jgi:hypothetical protein
MENYKENRPWGTFENLLDKEYCKVKQIIINDKKPHSNADTCYAINIERDKGIGEIEL